MIKVAFASRDDVHVDMHFGATERLVVYDVSPGYAELVHIGQFQYAVMKGENKDKALEAGQIIVPGEEMAPQPGELDHPPEDKVLAKLDFVKDCAAVYAASIGNSSIKRLMALGVQPVIVDTGHDIVDLLNEVSFALAQGGLSWVDRARARQRDADRFDRMAEEGWNEEEEVTTTATAGRHRLITSID
ncbi:MAG TPA: NifB/NifX family molybdenum-iron cluster-binding protein [Candidatus Competibacteraceae bacterium]|nr:NifB/NifX family molybdenum-iron cluster-binding protein [Candidatus Competibacteraceae bacterium]HQD56372.1 NifB/NifX family molybdenum-iron cluster-binding protein [Candidatus Competibacteraceae bacterium]